MGTLGGSAGLQLAVAAAEPFLPLGWSGRQQLAAAGPDHSWRGCSGNGVAIMTGRTGPWKDVQSSGPARADRGNLTVSTNGLFGYGCKYHCPRFSTVIMRLMA